jgi:hypothetical protein
MAISTTLVSLLGSAGCVEPLDNPAIAKVEPLANSKLRQLNFLDFT